MRKDASRAHFTPRKVQNFQRSLGLSGPAYACPLCSETFHQEPKLWAHAKASHQDSLQTIVFATPEDEERERERFRKDAMDRASVSAGKKIQNKATGGPELPHVKNISDQDGDAGQKAASDTPGRPSTAPEHTPAMERKISDLGRLSIGKDKALPNPLKRVAGGSASPEAPSGSFYAGQPASRTRHTKTLSGGPTMKHSWQGRAEGLPSEEYVRGPSGSKQRLFDPKTDDPNISNVPRRKKSQGLANVSYRKHPSRDLNPRQRKPNTTETGLKLLKSDATSEGPRVMRPVSSDQMLRPPTILERGSSDLQDEPESNTDMVREPPNRPISHDQLWVEVRSIHTGLSLVEAKCIEIDESQAALARGEDKSRLKPLNSNQWRSLIGLHKQLLYEHHDFFLASQHPVADSDLNKMAANQSMPARMWRHGIHSFLEVLRHRLPGSREHMLAFIHAAYSMMTLLYETVSTFEVTWAECLGDLGRYRMAIEEGEPEDREVWRGVARSWYRKTVDMSPTVGRSYHQLAGLARPYTLEQLSYYARSLTCPAPFQGARVSIMALFNPILSGEHSTYLPSTSLDAIIIKAHGLLFTFPKRSVEDIERVLGQLKEKYLNEYMHKNGYHFKRTGVFAAVSNVAALLEYGALTEQGEPRSTFRRTFEVIAARKLRESASGAEPSNACSDSSRRSSVKEDPPPVFDDLLEREIQISKVVVFHASDLAFTTLRIALDKKYWEKLYNLPLVHVMLLFVWSLLPIQTSLESIEKDVPWIEICAFLNHLATKPDAVSSKVRNDGFPAPSPSEGVRRPLTEDFVIRGQLYAQWYYPEEWFNDIGIDDEERVLEPPSMDECRVERVLWLAMRIAAAGRWIRYDNDADKFLTTEYVDELIETITSDSKNAARSSTEQYFPDSRMSEVSSQDYLPESDSVSLAVNESTSMIGATLIAAEGTAARTMSDTPSTPKAAEVEEPFDVPMMDISPGREQMEASSITAEKSEDAGLLAPTSIKSTSPQPTDHGGE